MNQEQTRKMDNPRDRWTALEMEFLQKREEKVIYTNRYILAVKQRVGAGQTIRLQPASTPQLYCIGPL